MNITPGELSQVLKVIFCTATHAYVPDMLGYVTDSNTQARSQTFHKGGAHVYGLITIMYSQLLIELIERIACSLSLLLMHLRTSMK